MFAILFGEAIKQRHIVKIDDVKKEVMLNSVNGGKLSVIDEIDSRYNFSSQLSSAEFVET